MGNTKGTAKIRGSFDPRLILQFFALSLIILIGTTGSSFVDASSASWKEPASAGTQLETASYTSEYASSANESQHDWRDYPGSRSLTLSFVNDFGLTYWTWSDHPNDERTAHFAVRRVDESQKLDVRFDIENIELNSVVGTDYSDNFSWELWDLRGASSNWDLCHHDNISSIRDGVGSSERIAYGETLSDLQRDGGDAGRSLTNAGLGGSASTDRDGNYCLIFTEEAGMNYSTDALNDCFHFRFTANGMTYVEGADSSWEESTEMHVDFINTGVPSQAVPCDI